MPIGTLLLTLSLFLLVALLIGLPLLDKKSPAMQLPSAREQFEAERLDVIRSIRELDFDYKTGKMDTDDYRVLRETWVKRGADILRQLDELKLGQTDADDEIETEIQKRAAKLNRG